MKNLLCLLLLFFAFACSNGNEPEIEKPEELYNVNFNISIFSQEITDLKSTKSSKIIKDIDYIVFNESGKFLNQKHYDSLEANFGVINDKLPAGQYYCAIIGHNTDLSRIFVENYNFFNDACISVSNANNDVFLDTLSFKVTDNNQNISLKLPRIVGKVQLVIKDALPDNIAKIKVTLVDIPWNYYFGNKSMYNRNDVHKEFNISSNEIGQKDFTVDYLIFGKDEGEKYTMVVKCYDVDSNLLVEKEISNFDVFRNKCTRLSGNLFDALNNTQTDFTIEVDTVWSEIIDYTF